MEAEVKQNAAISSIQLQGTHSAEGRSRGGTDLQQSCGLTKSTEVTAVAWLKP